MLWWQTHECFNRIFSSTCSYLPGTEAKELVTLLSEIVTETKEKSTCSHALWCLGKQGIASDIISSQVGLGVGDGISSAGMFSPSGLGIVSWCLASRSSVCRTRILNIESDSEAWTINESWLGEKSSILKLKSGLFYTFLVLLVGFPCSSCQVVLFI